MLRLLSTATLVDVFMLTLHIHIHIHREVLERRYTYIYTLCTYTFPMFSRPFISAYTVAIAQGLMFCIYTYQLSIAETLPCDLPISKRRAGELEYIKR